MAEVTQDAVRAGRTVVDTVHSVRNVSARKLAQSMAKSAGVSAG